MRPSTLLPALVLLAGCVRPEVEAFRQTPTPVSVVFETPASVPDRHGISREYAAAIRARLATRVVVVPEGTEGPANGATLRVNLVEVREGRHRREPSPAAVGVTTGIVAGALSALSGRRDAAFEGFWWGLWAGTHAAAHQERTADRLGYAPRRIHAVVDLVQPSAGTRDPLATFDVDPDEVIDAMDPLSRSDAEDEGRIREEEARAFSRVVVAHLQDRFGWTPKPKPSYFGAKPMEAAPEPRKD
jgi:hypothetical protein